MRRSTSSTIGSPVNPCGDPPVPVGGAQAPPTAEGGALRSQDLRTSGDPVSLDGTILGLNPLTGATASGNPLAGHADANARRIVAHGLRNPFRITVRPGTNEVWAGDVGWSNWEEIDRVANPTARRHELRLARATRGESARTATHPCRSARASNDLVTVPGADSLDLTTGMTIEAWINPSVLGGWRTILLKERPGQLSYGMYASGDVQRPSGWISIGSTDRGTNGTAAVPTNSWTHVASTYDGTTVPPVGRWDERVVTRNHRRDRDVHAAASDRRQRGLG